MKFVGSGRYRDPRIGIVSVRCLRTAKHIIAHWRGAELAVTVPPGVTPERYKAVLDSMLPRILQHKPTGRFAPGMQIDIDGMRVLFAGDAGPGRVFCTPTADGAYVLHHDPLLDPASPGAEKTVCRVLLNTGVHALERLLLPVAEAERKRLGTDCVFLLSKGRTRLGYCDVHRVIHLSGMLAYYPAALRRFVVLHEMAHCTHMNHGPAFKALLDRYCDGRMSQWNRQLKSYKPPF